MNTADLLRVIVGPCTPIVTECQPPRMGVRVLGQDLLLAVADVRLVRADMVVMRGTSMLEVLTGPTETSRNAALARWSDWPVMARMLEGAYFLACVLVEPGSTTIHNRDIVVPILVDENDLGER